MRQFLAATALVIAGMTLADVPRTLAATSQPVFNATCTTGSTTYPVQLQSHPANAFNPLQVVGGGVLVPLTVVLNGQTVQDKAPGIHGSALSSSLTTCTFQTSRGTFEVTGILTPPAA